jgi:hypothetical protein
MVWVASFGRPFRFLAAASRDVSRSGGGGVVGLELPPVSKRIKVDQG